MVLARGRFDEVRIEALMREHGAQVEDYKGKRLIVARQARRTPYRQLCRLRSSSPGFVAVGSTKLVRSAIDLHQGGNNPQAGVTSVTGNEELMNLVRSLDGGNAWAVGRFDALTSKAQLPDERRQPAAGHHLVRGQRPHQRRRSAAMIRAETRDEEAANNLRDVVRGFMALAKLQGGSRAGAAG